MPSKIFLARSSTEMSYFQPQSYLALVSSMLLGQASAIACLKSGAYSIVKPGMILNKFEPHTILLLDCLSKMFWFKADSSHVVDSSRKL